MHPSVRIAKRALDVAVSLGGLVATAPVSATIAALVYLDSGKPILYRQRRAGELIDSDGREVRCVEFEMLKFRTMRQDAEKHTGAVLASTGDARVTRIGRLLRKSRLDELPQLWNVLRGQMSLVGPRPERPELLRDLALAIPMFEERMRGVKPGITGLAQVNLGYTGEPHPGSPAAAMTGDLTNPFELEEAEGAVADEMRMKLLYDLGYVAALERFSTFVVTELSVIIKTPWVMIRGVGR